MVTSWFYGFQALLYALYGSHGCTHVYDTLTEKEPNGKKNDHSALEILLAAFLLVSWFYLRLFLSGILIHGGWLGSQEVYARSCFIGLSLLWCVNAYWFYLLVSKVVRELYLREQPQFNGE